MLADGDPARAVVLASLLALLVGVVMVVAGLAKFGFIADLLSKPTQIGYMNGLALTIVVGQLPKLFGFSVDADGLIGETRAFVSGISDGLANATAATLGIASLVGHPGAATGSCRSSLRSSSPSCWPRSLSTCSTWRRTASRRSAYCRKAFRRSPSRRSSGRTMPPLFVGALAIAVVALADTMSTASSFAARSGERVHGNQEMIGIGAANLAAGFFQGFPVSTSGSRTAVAEQAGLPVAGHRRGRRGRDHRSSWCLRHRLMQYVPAADARRDRHRGRAVPR